MHPDVKNRKELRLATSMQNKNGLIYFSTYWFKCLNLYIFQWAIKRTNGSEEGLQSHLSEFAHPLINASCNLVWIQFD